MRDNPTSVNLLCFTTPPHYPLGPRNWILNQCEYEPEYDLDRAKAANDYAEKVSPKFKAMIDRLCQKGTHDLG